VISRGQAPVTGPEGSPLAAVNIAGAITVTFTLLVNLARGYPLGSIAATVIIAAVLYALWARAGRPAGIEEAERHLDDPG
jgi:hypothetical protein